jgi:hypothetical protein
MTQTKLAIIAATKPSMEYAKLCMSMRLGNARYSAISGVSRSLSPVGVSWISCRMP